MLSSQIPVWGYEFAQPNPVQNVQLPVAPGIDLGDSHTTEFAYVFGRDGAGNPLTGQDLVLSDHVIGYWTRFAASGSPNHARPRGSLSATGSLLHRYETEEPCVLSIKNSPSPDADFAKTHHCALWQSLGNPEKLISSVP